MAIVFDGRQRAFEIDNETRLLLSKAGVKNTIKMASILVGESDESMIYLNLKKKKAENLGMAVDVIRIDGNISKKELIEKIESLGVDNSYQAIMVQLPLPKTFSTNDTKDIINAIPTVKDVDGMRLDSSYVAPVVLAVIDALGKIEAVLGEKAVKPSVAVMGAKGFVGQRIVNVLKDRNIKLVDKTIESDVVISATGEPNLIKESWVKEGVAVIDVGAPFPEFEEAVYQKSCFYTPVPGGIGPLTISYLMNNLAKSALP